MLKQLYTAIEKTYAANFITYYKSHAAHMNIRGRNFYADHKLLKHIYKYLQENIDTLGELIQSCGVGRVPETITMILETSSVTDRMPQLDADSLLMDVLDDLYELINLYHDLDRAGQLANYPDVSNLAADHIGEIAKYCWKLEATLEVPGRHTPTGRQ